MNLHPNGAVNKASTPPDVSYLAAAWNAPRAGCSWRAIARGSWAPGRSPRGPRTPTPNPWSLTERETISRFLATSQETTEWEGTTAGKKANSSLSRWELSKKPKVFVPAWRSQPVCFRGDKHAAVSLIVRLPTLPIQKQRLPQPQAHKRPSSCHTREGRPSSSRPALNLKEPMEGC